MRTRHLLVLGLAIAAGAAGAAGPAGAAVTPLPAQACAPVEYGGEGAPGAIVATDLPMQGASRKRSLQMVEGVRLSLERRGWQAGGVGVALQVCDDADALTGTWSAAACDRNAAAYAASPELVGVIGTYNSGCAARIMPVLSRAGIAMVSPGNTLVCLTLKAASCPADEPGIFSPGGRTYARVVPNDAYQGAALATYAVRTLKARRVAVLSGGDRTSAGGAAALTGAVAALKGTVVASRRWDPKAPGYAALFRSLRRLRPDTVLLAGLTEQHGGRLIRDKVAGLGDNRAVRLLALDGFAQAATIAAAGPAARGMFVSTPGSAPELLSTTLGRQTVAALRARFPGQAVEPFAPYASQAADVLLTSVAAHVGRPRPAIAAGIIGSTTKNGVIGTFSITNYGDPTPPRVTVSRAGSGSFAPLTLVTPAPAAIEGALTTPR